MLVAPEWRISVVCVVSVFEGGKVEGVGIENILFIDSRCPQSQSQPAGGGRQQSSDWSSWAEGEENKAHQSSRYRHHYTQIQHSDSIITQSPASLASPQADRDMQGVGLLTHIPGWRSLISTPELLPSVSLPVFPLNKSLRTFLCRWPNTIIISPPALPSSACANQAEDSVWKMQILMKDMNIIFVWDEYELEFTSGISYLVIN